MPTNEERNKERREIAENLRNMIGYGECRYAEQFYELLKETIMNSWDYHEFEDVADRLADLIELESERTCKPHGEWERTSQLQECRRVLCDCGHELGMDTRRGFPIKIVDFCELPNYCPNCGARVVE